MEPLLIDPMMVVYALVAAILVILVAFLVGRMLDPVQRVKLMRRLLKRDYGFLYVLSKDKQNIIRSIMVDFLKDRVVISKSRFDPGKELVWVISEGNIYREDAIEKGSKLLFKVREGLPVAFVCEDNLQSVDFNIPKSGSSPQEAASLFEAFFSNQEAKRMALAKKPKDNTWSLPILLLIVGILLLGYLIWQNQSAISDVKGMVIGINQTLSGAHITTNQSGIITGPTPTR